MSWIVALLTSILKTLNTKLIEPKKIIVRAGNSRKMYGNRAKLVSIDEVSGNEIGNNEVRDDEV